MQQNPARRRRCPGGMAFSLSCALLGLAAAVAAGTSARAAAIHGVVAPDVGGIMPPTLTPVRVSADGSTLVGNIQNYNVALDWNNRPFVWTKETGVTLLPAQLPGDPPADYAESGAFDASADLSLIVGQVKGPGVNRFSAVRWDTAGNIYPLEPPPGVTNVFARLVSPDGRTRVTGSSLWTSAG